MLYCNRKLVYALLQLKSFTCTVTVADFSIYFVHNIIFYKFLNALSQRTTFASPIAIDHYYLHCCKKLFFKYYSNSQLLYALLDITTFGFTVANEKLYATVAFATFSSAMTIADLYWHYCN